MKILFIVPSYKPAYIYGGPVVVIAMLAENLVKLGHSVTVYTTTANGKAELNVEPGRELTVEGVSVTYFKRLTGDHTHLSFDLWMKLRSSAAQFDVVHIHSWWNVLAIGAALVCYTKGIRPILSPHGMFSDYILKTNNSILKKLVHGLIGKKLLNNSYLHVSTDMELEESRKIIADWEATIIANPVKLSATGYQKATNTDFTIGFLSRIDPKKGLDILLDALAEVSFNFKLLVAGDGEPEYIQSLKNQATQLGIQNQIEWVGWMSGEEKFSFLSGLDLFALTSHSENFAIVVIEALSVGTSVMITDRVGLCKFVQDNDFGWVTGLDAFTVSQALESAFLDITKRLRIAEDVPQKIALEYDELNLAKKYVEMYEKASLKD
ncbi:XrtY-associated glycosyltransferase XYAG1 [Pedobacter sp. SYSU D00535]|uniref:XrtY-associated glycosyltransferase XYAG1 n=1 Tax=Pedobacter sp. SYSU D00535 TaxID=2810308 RepID=UPI001A976760|nr:glycosyltransferase [Pedobacter sp. SYSU D00535]